MLSDRSVDLYRELRRKPGPDRRERSGKARPRPARRAERAALIDERELSGNGAGLRAEVVVAPAGTSSDIAGEVARGEQLCVPIGGLDVLGLGADVGPTVLVADEGELL